MDQMHKHRPSYIVIKLCMASEVGESNRPLVKKIAGRKHLFASLKFQPFAGLFYAQNRPTGVQPAPRWSAYSVPALDGESEKGFAALTPKTLLCCTWAFNLDA